MTPITAITLAIAGLLALPTATRAQTVAGDGRGLEPWVGGAVGASGDGVGVVLH